MFSLDKLVKCGRDIQALPRSEIAFALRAIPSTFSQFTPLALVLGRVRAAVDEPHLVAMWDQLTQTIHDANLGDVCSESCLLDGGAVSSVLGVQGRGIGKSIQLILQAGSPFFMFLFVRADVRCSGNSITRAAQRRTCLQQ